MGHSRTDLPKKIAFDTTSSPIFVKFGVNSEFGAKTTKVGKIFLTEGPGIMPPKVGPLPQPLNFKCPYLKNYKR